MASELSRLPYQVWQRAATAAVAALLTITSVAACGQPGQPAAPAQPQVQTAPADAAGKPDAPQPKAKVESPAPSDEENGQYEGPPPGAIQKGTDGIPCRSGDVLAGVYHPARLQVVKPCAQVTGKVTKVKHEPDGDYHILVLLDAPYADVVNDVNREKQGGALVVEVIPSDQAKVPTPKVGDQVRVTGAQVLDKQHGGWAEIHPAWLIERVDASQAQAPAQAPAPAPAQAPARPAGASGGGGDSTAAVPDNVTAICRDGTYSFSQHARGTCSHHGGVGQWVHHPAS